MLPSQKKTNFKIYFNQSKTKGMTRRIEHIFEDKEEKKRCCSCQTYLPLTDYNPCKSTWDKIRPTCKGCLHLKRMANRIQMTLYNKRYWQKTQETQKIRHREWRKKNVDHRRRYNKKWNQTRKLKKSCLV